MRPLLRATVSPLFLLATAGLSPASCFGGGFVIAVLVVMGFLQDGSGSSL
jgi:hypothetical protein